MNPKHCGDFGRGPGRLNRWTQRAYGKGSSEWLGREQDLGREILLRLCLTLSCRVSGSRSGYQVEYEVVPSGILWLKSIGRIIRTLLCYVDIVDRNLCMEIVEHDGRYLNVRCLAWYSNIV